MRKKPKAVKPVKAWALVDTDGSLVGSYGSGLPWLYATRLNAVAGSATGFRAARVQITLAKQPRRRGERDR